MAGAMGSGPFLLQVRFHHIAEGSYPSTIKAFQGTAPPLVLGPLTCLVGENGSGKSTLLEAIALQVGLNPSGGSRNFRFGGDEGHEDLSDLVRVVRSASRPTDSFFHRADKYVDLVREVERLGVSGYGDRSLAEQSRGESTLSLFLNRFRGNGLYIMDEPESSLSPERQLAAAVRIYDLLKQNSQFVIATHSPILMALPGASILQLDNSGIHRVELEQTSHFAVMRRFLLDPIGYLEQALGASD